MSSPSDNPASAAVAQHVSRGECILFLGAGVHYPPPAGSEYSYPESERPPLGSELSERLARICRFSERFPKDSVTNLQRVSLYYESLRADQLEGESQGGRHGLVDEIKKAIFFGKKPSPVVRALAELNFPLVITTNYDQLFEKALQAADKSPLVSVYDKDGSRQTVDLRGNPSATEPFVLKVHGDIQTPESIVITDEDYIQFVLRMSDKEPLNPIPLTFRYFLKKWPTLFVGYSLIDYNLRLLFKTLRWKVDAADFPNMYSVDLSPDPLIVKVWDTDRGYIRFISQDVWTFVPTLYKMVKGEEMPK